ncbi:MAG: pilin, partial [Gammaproteobacteria bacterium]
GMAVADFGGTQAGKYVSGIAFTNIATSQVQVEATFGTGAAAALQNSVFAISTDDGGNTWECGVNTVATPTDQMAAKYMPSNCR